MRLKFARQTPRKRVGRLSAIAMGLLLSATVLTISSTSAAPEASAAGCYAGAVKVTKPKGSFTSPTGDGWFKTTSACTDINYKQDTSDQYNGGYWVRVCFQNGGCQSSYKWISNDSDWTVIASNVKDGTNYRFEFKLYSWAIYWVAD